jgi:hypothetical protein
LRQRHCEIDAIEPCAERRIKFRDRYRHRNSIAIGGPGGK